MFVVVGIRWIARIVVCLYLVTGIAALTKTRRHDSRPLTDVLCGHKLTNDPYVDLTQCVYEHDRNHRLLCPDGLQTQVHRIIQPCGRNYIKTKFRKPKSDP